MACLYMRLIKIFFWAFLLLTSCSTGLYQYHSVAPEKVHQVYRVVPLYINKSFNKDYRMQVAAAINETNYMLNGSMRLEVKTWDFDQESDAGKEIIATVRRTHEGMLVLGLSEDDPMISELVADNGTLAFVNSIGHANIMVVVIDRIGGRDLKKITEHELGHALGAMHTNAKSLMYPYYGNDMQVGCFDRITVAQIAHFQHIDVDNLNYCRTEDFE